MTTISLRPPGISSRALSDRRAFLIALIVATGVVMSLLSPYFLRTDNLLNMTQFGAVVGLLALGQTLVILGGGGGIDISVGSTLSLCGVVMGIGVGHSVNVWAAALITLALGLVLGATNGILITVVKVPALITTLGTLYLFGSGAEVIAGDRQITGFDRSGFSFLGHGVIAGVPTQVLLVLIPVYVLTAWIIGRAGYGRRVYETGNNDQALRLAGGSPSLVRFSLYCVSGLLAALGAVVTNSWLLIARANAGADFTLDSITIAVLGGTSIFGGRGRVSGTFLAVVLIVVLNSGLQLAGVAQSYQTGILGVVLILSVLLNQLLIRRSGLRT